MKKDVMPKIYEIDIHLECVCKGDLLVPLLSFCSEEIQDFVNQEYYAFFDDAIKVFPNIDSINKKIEGYLKFYGIPSKLIFVLNREEGEYSYINEIFTGTEIKVDKGLLEVCRINKTKANIHMLKYSNREIEKINEIMLNINEQTKRFNCKIIDFESRKRRK